MLTSLKNGLRSIPQVRDAYRCVQNQLLPHPKPRKSTVETDHVVLAGMFRTSNGIGQCAKYLYESWRTQNSRILAVDTSEILNQVDSDSPIPLSQFPPAQRGTLILVANAPETRTILKALKLRRWNSWNIIGYWAWELPEPDPSWLPIARHLSEIWTPSSFVKNAFASHVRIPVKTVPIPVSAPAAYQREPTSIDRSLSYLVMADGLSSFYRKNVLTAVRIFGRALGDRADARLTVKIRNGSQFPQFMRELYAASETFQNIKIVDASLSADDRWQMIADHDIIVSTHRSEGYGLHLAEAMTIGKCIVATGWSGNLEFMTPQNSVLLPFKLEDVFDPYDVYASITNAKWATIYESVAVASLAALHDDRSRVQSIGRHAASDMRAINSPSSVDEILAT